MIPSTFENSALRKAQRLNLLLMSKREGPRKQRKRRTVLPLEENKKKKKLAIETFKSNFRFRGYQRLTCVYLN